VRSGIPRNVCAIGIAVCAVLGAACSKPVESGVRPDIVLVLTDDQRYDALGCAGHPLLRTPAFDRIAAEGAYFENSSVVSPICSPSRATILTGLYGSTTGIISTALKGDVLKDHALFAEILQRNGYETAFFGKWHLPNPGARPYRGFDHWVSFEGQGQYFDETFNVDGTPEKRAGYASDALTDMAVEWIRGPHERPYFLLLSLKNPHFPYAASPARAGTIDAASVVLPRTMTEPRAAQSAFVRSVRASPRMLALPERARDLAGDIARYDECVLSADDCTGRVLASLDERAAPRATCVIMTSDNGILMGEHGLLQKNRSYEESIRVPLLIRFPGEIAPGTRLREPVLNLDLAPTILDLAGAPIPSTMQGASLRVLWRDAKPTWRMRTLHLEPPRSGNEEPAGIALRTERWKYVRYRPGGIEEVLYDLRNDPDEVHDLAADPAHRSVLEGLRTDMRAEMQRFDFPARWWEPIATTSAESED
jgi:N-acetylglucosamine-6-sulfatase